jgi:catalase
LACGPEFSHSTIGRILRHERQPDNFFAETEQLAMHVDNIVPGIDFTNDPLLQGRLFSYTDTQLIRLVGPNFHEIPTSSTRWPRENLALWSATSSQRRPSRALPRKRG